MERNDKQPAFGEAELPPMQAVTRVAQCKGAPGPGERVRLDAESSLDGMTTLPRMAETGRSGSMPLALAKMLP
jgi:hypothetical protein